MANSKSTKNWANTEFVQGHLERSSQHVYEKARRDLTGWYSTYESPLEVAFDVWWRALVMALEIGDGDVLLAHQRIVAIGDKTYRLDFALEPSSQLTYRASSLGIAIPLLCVELDGHDFHERTKEQVSYRNQRDRDLTAAGWTVLHYSGSEFHRDPRRCVIEAHAFAQKLFSWEWECSIIEAETAR